MLSKLFGKKSDHPMADIKSAQALLNDLPKDDALKLLMELTEWLESVVENREFKLGFQLELVRLLDDTAQPYARKLAYEYFSPYELGTFQENRLWLVLGNLARHTADAYYTIFNRHCVDDKADSAVKGQLPWLMARTAHAMSMQLKYACAHYGPVNNVIWADLAHLYKYAEQESLLEVPVKLSGSAQSGTSVQSQIGYLMCWYGCGVSNLKPLYIHLCERITAQYESLIEMKSQHSERTLFSFDLNRPAAPHRINAGATVHEGQRFVGMAALRPVLEGLQQVLDKNIVPHELNLGGAYDAELVRVAVQHLLGYLIAPPQRHSARRGIKVKLNVINGFEQVIARADVPAAHAAEPPACWEIEDISAGGFRTLLPSSAASQVRIGSLLGVQPDGVGHWGVAVVRRLMRDDASQLQMGAEMLASQVTVVALHLSGGGGGIFDDGQSALWLHARTGEEHGEIRLLMKAETFSNARSLQAQLDGRNFLLIPIQLQEKGLDYDLARFRIIEKEAGGEDESY